MNKITRFNRSQVCLFRHLRTVNNLDAKLLSIDLNRIIKPQDIANISIGENMILWLLNSGERIMMRQEQMLQYLEDLAEL